MTITNEIYAPVSSAMAKVQDFDIWTLPVSSLIMATKAATGSNRTYHLSGVAGGYLDVQFTNDTKVLAIPKGQPIPGDALRREARTVRVILNQIVEQKASTDDLHLEKLPFSVGLTIHRTVNGLGGADTATIAVALQNLFSLLFPTNTAGVLDTAVLERVLNGGLLKE